MGIKFCSVRGVVLIHISSSQGTGGNEHNTLLSSPRALTHIQKYSKRKARHVSEMGIKFCSVLRGPTPFQTKRKAKHVTEMSIKRCSVRRGPKLFLFTSQATYEKETGITLCPDPVRASAHPNR